MAVIVAIVSVVVLCFISGLNAKHKQTCKDLESVIESRDRRIEKLRSELEEYKLGDNNKVQDVSDDCNQLKTCSKCLWAENNLNCGWCFLRKRCSVKDHCPGNDSDTRRWIPHGKDECPSIAKITPSQVAATTARMVDIIIPRLPSYDGIFICSFEVLRQTIISKAERTEHGVACPFAATKMLSKIPEPEKSIQPMEVRVSVRTANGPNFVSTKNITIYNCGGYETCTECASSSSPCSWCIYGKRCTHDVSENCRNDLIVDSLAHSRQTLRPGPGFCTKIIQKEAGVSTEIIFPAGTTKRIALKIDNIHMAMVNSRIFCKVSTQPKVKGQLLGDTVYCDSIELRGIGRNPVSSLSINVLWDDDSKVDNPQNLHIIVFDCSLMATSCGTCLGLPEQYKCGWCEHANTCTVQDQCRDKLWQDRKQLCTKPDIPNFHPKSGLITRETNITLEGVNLGREFKDIDGIRLITEDKNLVADCKPFKELYVSSIKIVCRLDVPEVFTALENNETLKGYFEVKVSSAFIATSKEEFNFVNPFITGLNPVKGIKSGGTLLEIQGEHLDAGSTVDIFTRLSGSPCKIVSRKSSAIRCITSASKNTLSSPIEVVFDGEKRISPGYFFYVEDPWITSVKTEFYADGPRGTPSGGSLILVEGGYLNHIVNPPYIYVIVGNEEYIGPCRVESPTDMKCLSPRVPAEKLNVCNNEGFLELEYGFKMDAVEDVQNISTEKGFKKYHMFADPFFMPFDAEGKVQIYKSQYIVINGRHMDSVFSEEDITVEIGSGKCKLTSLSHSQLTCKPPEKQPPAKDGDTNKLPEVMVKVAETMEFFIGFVRYNS